MIADLPRTDLHSFCPFMPISDDSKAFALVHGRDALMAPAIVQTAG